MDPRLRLAVDANIGWYADIFGLHGIASRLDDGLWWSVGRPLPLHSDAVVAEPTVTAEQVAAVLSGRPQGGFKDSFATLGPAVAGTHLLFSATWLHCPGGTGESRTALDAWHRVSTPAELERWNAGWDTAGVLLPGLLERGHIAVLSRLDSGGEMRAGAVARLGSGAVDLSNVHGVDGHAVDWAELRAAVGARFPHRPIVGYERGDDLAAALTSGFEPVGELEVWAR